MARDFSQVGGPAGAARRVYEQAVPYHYRVMFGSWRQRRAQEQIEERIAADRARMARYQRDLDAMLASHPERKGVIHFVPSANWTAPLLQRSHQMAIALAELGYLVLYGVYIDSPDDVETFREIHPNLALFRAPPQVFRGLEEAVVVSYTFTYPWVKRARARRIIYELTDRFETWSDFPERVLRSYHRHLLARAMVVVGASADLMAEMKPTRPDAILCPNAADDAHVAVGVTATDDASLAPPDVIREAAALSGGGAHLDRLDVTASGNTWQARARLLTAALDTRERLDRATQAAATVAR